MILKIIRDFFYRNIFNSLIALRIISLHFMRHGQTNEHESKTIHISKLSKLSKNGIESVKKKMETLKHLNIRYIYSSPYARSIETSRIIANIMKLNIITYLELSDVAKGVLY
ncbi:MAG: histidine phosphatase family protein [Candidatus Zixiibacteriota bacterium]|nr:MAG: histidine phosphatase family protein [candidate division Zixibacteria bacterium]